LRCFSFCAHVIARWLILHNWTVNLIIAPSVLSLPCRTQLTHCSNCPGYNFSERTTKKTLFFYCYMSIHCHRKVYTELLPWNGLHNTVVYLPIPLHCIATAVHTTIMLYGSFIIWECDKIWLKLHEKYLINQNLFIILEIKHAKDVVLEL
jgi:hypothetical protein